MMSNFSAWLRSKGVRQLKTIFLSKSWLFKIAIFLRFDKTIHHYVVVLKWKAWKVLTWHVLRRKIINTELKVWWKDMTRHSWNFPFKCEKIKDNLSINKQEFKKYSFLQSNAGEERCICIKLDGYGVYLPHCGKCVDPCALKFVPSKRFPR